MDNVEAAIRSIRAELKQAEYSGMVQTGDECRKRRALLVREVERQKMNEQDEPVDWLVNKVLDILRSEASIAIDEPLIGHKQIRQFMCNISEELFYTLRRHGLPVYKLNGHTNSTIITTKGTLLNWIRSNAEAYALLCQEHKPHN